MNWKKPLKLLLVGALTIGLWPTVLAPQTAKAAAAAAPGGVTTNLHLWLRADTGVTTANGTVSAWNDQSGNNRDFSQTDATKQPVYNDGSNRINFNEAVTFDGTNDYLLNANGVLGSSAYNNFNVFLMSDLGSGSNSILWEETSGGGRLNVHLPYSGAVYWDAGSQGTERVSASAGTVGPKYIWNFNYGINGSGDAGQSIYRDGNALVSAPSRTIPLTGINHKISFGSQYDTNGNPVSYYNGQVGELIFYSGPLTAIDRLKINSYLAIKYGKSLNNLNYLDSNATPIWNADLNYNSNIAGIARDDAQGLYQKQSRSANVASKITIGIGAQLSMKNESISETLADKQSLIWGDNGQPLKFDKQIGTTDKNHAERIWKVQNTGNVGEVLIAIPKNMIPANSTLLVNDNGSDFTNATEHQLTVVSFEGIDYFTTKAALANGQFFTFAAPVPVPNNAVLEHAAAGGNKIILTFDKEVGWTNSTGLTITIDGTPITPVINADPTDAKKMIFTLPTGTDVTGKTVNVSYNGIGNLIGTNSVPVNRFSIDAKTGTLASAANNSVNESPSSVTVGGSVTLTAAGDRQSEIGAVYGDERYIPTSWSSTESGKSGTFSVSGVTYTSTYTPATAGSYTVTATFTKQTWDGSAWTDTTTTDVKTTTVTAALPVIGGSVAISGTAKVGQTLTVDLTGITYSATTNDNPTYQWYRNGVAIASVTGSSYALTADNIGAVITVKVTADGVHATGSVTSAATGAVAAADGAAAPTNVILDASAKTLTWNNVSGYANVSDYEYTVDGGTTWTAATANPQPLASVPNPVSNAQVRVKGDSSAGRAPGVIGTAALPAMGGSVAINGVAKVGQTLTADLSGITYTPSTSGNMPTYQWYRDGVAIANATGSSYTLTAADLGTAITVKVTADGTHATGSVTSSATAAVAAAAAPAAPDVASKTTTSITLLAVAGQEYSKDGGVTWQDSPTFSGLTPNTDYTIVTRVKATATQNASAISAGTTIRTLASTSTTNLSGGMMYEDTTYPTQATITVAGVTGSVYQYTGKYAVNGVPVGVYPASITITNPVNASLNATFTATATVDNAGNVTYGPFKPNAGAPAGMSVTSDDKGNIIVHPSTAVSKVASDMTAAIRTNTLEALQAAHDEFTALTPEEQLQISRTTVENVSNAILNLLQASLKISSAVSGVANPAATRNQLDNQKGMLLTPAEIAQLLGGQSLNVTLNLNAADVSTSTTPGVSADKGLIETRVTSSAAIIGFMYDINITKKVDVLNSSGTVITPGASQLVPVVPEPISITLPIPTNLLGYKYFAIVRVHGGVAEFIPASVNGTTVTFSSTKFSTYGLVYSNQMIFADNLPGTGPSLPSTDGGSGGGGFISPTVTIDNAAGGKVTVDNNSATSGTKVTITVTPDAGYTLDKLSITDDKGNVINYTDLGNGTYTYVQPSGSVKINAAFKALDKAPASAADTGVSKLLNTMEHLTYLSGYEDGTFRSDGSITRAEVAQMFYNLLKNQDVNTSGKHFADVPEKAWYAKAVNTLASLGIINGYKDGSFAPNKAITRAEFTIIAVSFSNKAPGNKSFTDVSNTHWAYSNITTSAEYGWVNGYPNGTFEPNKTITRAESATIVNRMLNRQPDKKAIDASTSFKVFKDVSSGYWAYYDIMEATHAHKYKKSNGMEIWIP
ncbi:MULTISPECIES: S-layer homology domain-containing protein [unclassified Paenibacillus]|uniref:S-layer homology domain-containing protein n=1 Tax=unclassified Paenibacillus TaxID=185978 RepID=UPI0027D9047B|nr:MULTISPECIES: S-layer homology domain-containing protein [unclassified Paenibacillus]